MACRPIVQWPGNNSFSSEKFLPREQAREQYQSKVHVFVLGMFWRWACRGLTFALQTFVAHAVASAVAYAVVSAVAHAVVVGAFLTLLIRCKDSCTGHYDTKLVAPCTPCAALSNKALIP